VRFTPIEIVEPLAQESAGAARGTRYRNISARSGDGLQRVAGARAVRCHHRHAGAAADASAGLIEAV